MPHIRVSGGASCTIGAPQQSPPVTQSRLHSLTSQGPSDCYLYNRQTERTYTPGRPNIFHLQQEIVAPNSTVLVQTQYCELFTGTTWDVCVAATTGGLA